jgi:ribulose-phosphate 3-epimerase
MSIKSPEPGWLTRLPRDRLLGEISLWSADLARIADDIDRVEPGTDIFHLDVADGRFAPSFLFFPDLVSRIRALTRKPLHVHLMVSDDILLAQVEQFATAGADLISIHVENTNAMAAIGTIRKLGREAGIVLQVETDTSAIGPFLGKVAIVTLLGTRIGVKGQGLDPAATRRIRSVRARTDALDKHNRPLIAADGGIRESTVPALRDAGADTVVMGSLALGAEKFGERIAWLRALPDPGHGSQG